MTLLTYSFEGGSNGSSLSVTGAGSGDTNFNTVSIGASATAAYDNTHVYDGTLAGKFGGGSASAAYVAWSTALTAASITTVWFRAYCYFTANPSANFRLLNVMNSSGGLCGGINLLTTGLLRTVNASAATVQTASVAIPLNAWFRIEGFVTGSATVGQMELKLWSTAYSQGTPDWTLTSAATQNTSGPVSSIRYGMCNNQTGLGNFWLDDLGASTTAYIGPVPVPPLTVVQASAPTFLASLTGPVNVTLAQPTGNAGTSSLVVCATSECNNNQNPHATAITLGGAADNWQEVVILDSNSRGTTQIWYDPGCASGQTAVAVTFGNSNGTTGNLWVTVYEVTGILRADRTSFQQGTGTTFSSGTSPKATQQAEIFFGCADATATSITVTGVGTWTTQTLAAGTLGGIHCDGYQIVASGGTATFSGTLPASDPSSVVVATFYIGTVLKRWSGPVFTIDVNANSYAGRSLTSTLQPTHADFPGGGSPQTQQSLPCQWEPFTDYFQEFPWPGCLGFMSPPWITGPAQTGLTNCVAALYLGSGVGNMTDFDSGGYPLNKRVVTAPSTVTSLPVPAGAWPGAPTMPGGGTAIPAIPLIAWNLGNNALIDIVNGVFDTGTIIPVAQQCAAWPADSSGNPAYGTQPGGQVLIRLMHEFNLPSSSYYCPGSSTQPAGTTTDTFVAAWQHIVQIFAQQGATNVRWVWCPNVGPSGAGSTSGTTTNSGTTALMYPGDAYVDYIGIDGYNKQGPTWKTFQDVFQTTYNWITVGDQYTIIPGASAAGPICNTKPMIICETSSWEDDNFTSPPQTKAQYIADIATVVPASMPLVQGVHIWHDCNDNLESPATSSPGAASAWSTFAGSWTGRPELIQGVTSQLIVNVTASISGTGTAGAVPTVRAGAGLAAQGLVQTITPNLLDETSQTILDERGYPITDETGPVTGMGAVAGAGAATAVATVGARAATMGTGTASIIRNVTATAAIAGAGTAGAVPQILARSAVAGAGAVALPSILSITPAALAGQGLAKAGVIIRLIDAPVLGVASIIAHPEAASIVDISAEPQATVSARLVLNTATQSDGKAAGPTQQNGKAVGGCALTIAVANIVQDRGK